MTPPAAPLAALLDRARLHVDEDALAPGDVRVAAAVRPLACALLAEQASPLLVVVPNERDVEPLVDGLAAFLGADAVAAFPAWETLPHERLSPQPATVGQRLRVLDRLARGGAGAADAGGVSEAHAAHDAGRAPLRAVVAPVRALLQPMDPRLVEREPIRLGPGYEGGLDGLVEGLAQLGYTRVPLVDSRGEFAVRGGIVDVFPTAADHPVRVEFFGDDVDELRTFAVADQRTLERVDELVVDPARELVLDAETAETARRAAKRTPALADRLYQLADGVAFEGMEALVTAIHPAPAWLPDLVPDGAGLVVCDPVRVEGRATELREQAAELMVAGWGAEAEDDGVVDDLAGFAAWDDVVARARGPVWRLDPFTGEGHDVPGGPWDSFRGDMAAVAEHARRLAADGQLVVLTTDGHGAALRLGEVLREAGVAARTGELPPGRGGGAQDMPAPADPDAAGVAIVESSLREGFRAPELGLAVLGSADLFGPQRSRAGRRLPSRRQAAETVLDLAPGDPVVHTSHGVGRYVGIVTRELRGPTSSVGGGAATVTRDYVVVEYAGGDRLFVPSDNVDAISRYVGGEDPKIMRMGGAEWERAKGKVRKAVRDIAGELIRLYQARMHSTGHAFGEDTTWQAELEQAFPHVETPDQMAVIDEAKEDMATPVPMDRLVCGDVGYGKTEIAVRAAAKAVFDGKQVAVLVPTTLLAQQHGETFTERFAGFPVEIAVLSRFTPPKEARRVLDGLAAGTVDLVIGTHRLLGKDVAFKDLGLLVVDEEQRFGVAHKERLKALRTSVDVLTMTATPIPRTMEMAVTGIRDLSTIDTPPEERQPIVTHVGEWDERLAALALRRELLREGQVFWVHNQVATIDAAAERVRQLVPDARVEVAHGQMDEAALERVMLRFWQREFDVLVSTTIIESGLDIPNANTLIIERADLLGLAQMYQLRGRVGRSTVRGYAYLFHPSGERLTDEAHRRLETVATHTGLGSGLSIALKDLEIRGAGSVLGADQSGQVAAVGFDAYAQLMAEAVADLTDGQQGAGALAAGGQPEAEITVDLPVDAHLPHDYVPDEALRLEAYRKIAAVRDARAVQEVTDELTDRYGPPPEPARRLLSIAALRAAVRRWGITDVTMTPAKRIRVSPVELSEAQQVRLRRRHPDAILNVQASALELPQPREGDLVAWLAGELKAILAAPKGGQGA